MFDAEKIAEVLDLYRRLRSPFRVSSALRMDVKDVWNIIEENQDKLAARPNRYDGNGRPDLAVYAVARRKVTDDGWDNDSAEIRQAREDYEAGTHDLATARDGAWLILYAFPQKKVTPRPGYFKPSY